MTSDSHVCPIRHVSFLCAVIVTSAMLSGCTWWPPGISAAGGSEIVTAPLGSISIYQLAGRLDMQVVESGATSAVLRNGANAVMVFADPSGRAYVNGRPTSIEGGIVPVSVMLFIPEKYEYEIRGALRPIAAKTIGPEPPKIRNPSGRGKTIVVDAGHGGRDPGAISIIGLREKSVNLAAAKMVARKLREQGVNVILTRRSDVFVELNERAAIANRAKADLFVSIHADSYGNPSVSGFSVYISRSASPQSQRLSGLIVRELATTGAANRGVRRSNFRVLVRTSCPAVLIELGFLSNRAEAMRLGRDEYLSRLAGAISRGILKFSQ